jgi:(S)-2-hydroxyglutarate dehydrogenase
MWSSVPPYDYLIIGGGLVGLATAFALVRRFPGVRLLLLEKEAGWAQHQSGRNSGVIHSGLYYRPGSLKARYCIEGARDLVEFCRENEIPHEICGKLVIAAADEELPRLRQLQERGLANGLEVRALTSDQLRELEPAVRGAGGLQVLSTGIVQYAGVAMALVRLIGAAGGELLLGSRVMQLRETDGMVIAESTRGAFAGRYLINCAGLESDRVARMTGLHPAIRILPFRGDYYGLRPERRGLIRHLVYPVPDPAFPFLGVHLTRTIEGGVHCGPNAVLALKREGYSRAAFSARDVAEILGSRAFWALARRHWRTGLREVHRSLSKAAFARSLQRLVPDLTEADLVPAPSGVRAQAVAPDGRLVDDFVLVPSRRSLHVLNAPSPAATAALALGRAIAEQAAAAIPLRRI